MLRSKKVMVSILCAVVILCAWTVFVGCSNVIIEYHGGIKVERMQYALKVYIAWEYEEKFKNREFTVEDFDYDGIAEIRCETYHGEGWACTMKVYLKDAGKKQIEEAKLYFESLEFVRKVTFCSHQLTTVFD